MSFKEKERRMSTTLQLDEKEPVRRGSMFDMEPLEDIVSCPIHLGILEDPRQLPCGHAFCLECLQSYFTTVKTVFSCPICRGECPVPKEGPRGWPTAFTHTHVLEFVKEQRVKRYARSAQSNEVSPINRKGSIFGKADLLKTLAEELASKKSRTATDDKAIVIHELNLLLTRLKSQEESEVVTLNPENCSSGYAGLSNSSCAEARLEPTAPPLPSVKRGSYETQCEVEGVRHTMRYYCEYRIKREQQSYCGSNSGFSIKRNSDISQTAMDSPAIASSLPDSPCLDIDINPANRRHVFADASGNIVYFHGPTSSMRKFKPSMSSGEFTPIHMRVIAESVFISGLWMRDAEYQAGIIIRFDFEGNILSQSRDFPVDSSEYLPVQGFDINLETEEVYLTKPSRQEISVLSLSLVETDRHWVFHDPPLYPSYLCRSGSDGEIWATCPSQESIMILSEDSGIYNHFGTDKIFGSAPSHIICTTDKRVCFLDDRESRVFWIQKRHDYLCIQRLSFGASLRNSQIKLLQPLSGNRILITDEKRIYTAKPTKEVDKTSKCFCL